MRQRAPEAWARPGDELPLFETPLGRIGLLLGYDAAFPEPATVLARHGAEVIAHPTTWRLAWEPSLVICERASENRVSILSAARWDSPVARGGMINALSLSTPLRAADLNPIWPVEAPRDRELYVTADGATNWRDWTGEATIVTSVTTVADGLWHHIAGVYVDNGVSELYIDGVLQGSISASGIYNSYSSPFLTVGIDSQESSYLAGAVDDVRVHVDGRAGIGADLAAKAKATALG